MTRSNLHLRFGLALLLFALASSTASAASSFSNPLTGFTGNSTQSATQTALTAAGFSFSSTAGLHEDPETFEFVDPTVQFDSAGAHFGDLFAGNGGRNYIRTLDADYANVSFVAEITFVAPDIDNQDIYFGLGAGDAVPTAFRTPDWQTQNSSVMYWGETDLFEPSVSTFATHNGQGPFVSTAAPGLADGTHRVRIEYNWFRKTADFSFDFDYAGGAFTADLTAPSVNVLAHYGADGWPNEPARIFFGGDDGIVVRDFQVAVSTPSMLMGDFNDSGTITPADWVILRNNQHTDLSGKTFEEAYSLGDLNADLKNNHADFVMFKTLYEATNGSGSFALMLATVPEPSTLVLLLGAGLLFFPAVRRPAGRA